MAVEGFPPPRSELFDGFAFERARDFLDQTGQYGNELGVYCLFVDDGHSLLARCGFSVTTSEEWDSSHGKLLYVGEAGCVKWRVGQHLRGDSHVSNFRKSLMGLELSHRVFEDCPSPAVDLLAAEAWLSDWLGPRTVVGYKPCRYPGDLEAALIERSESPLNVVGRAPDDFMRHLKEVRTKMNPLVSAVSRPKRRYRR
jgi:hypothetical protein